MKPVFSSKPCVNKALWQVSGKITDNKDYIFISTANTLLDNQQVVFHPELILHEACKTKEDYLGCTKITNLAGNVISINKKNYNDKILSEGSRVPQGLFWDQGRKKLFISDHGPRGGDKLSIVKEGAHFGWPYISIGIPYSNLLEKLNKENFKGIYNGNKFSHLDAYKEYEMPIFSFVPSIGISAITKNLKNFNLKDWGDNLIIGSLKDKSIYNVALQDNKVVYTERVSIGYRVRSIAINRTHLILSSDTGEIIFVQKDTQTRGEGPFPKH